MTMKRGPDIGQKYLKSTLKRLAREHPEKLEQACLRLMEDMAGETEVEHVFNHQGEIVTHKNRIGPADRQRALSLWGDRVDGKPIQELRTEGGATTNVIVVRTTVDEPELPASVQAILQQREREEAGILDDDEDEDE